MKNRNCIVSFVLVSIGIILLFLSCVRKYDREEGAVNMKDIELEADTLTESVASVKEKPDLSETSLMIDYMLHSEHSEEYQRGILMRMASDAPEYAERILSGDYDKFLVVDKRRMLVILYNRYGLEIITVR